MSDLSAYLAKRNISKDQMEQARNATREYIDAYALRQARSEGGMMQVQLAEAMGFRRTASRAWSVAIFR